MIDTSKTGYPCKCCDGSGIQINKDALKVLCPCCGGTGKDCKREENASGNECPCYTEGYSKCPIHGKEHPQSYQQR